MSNSIKIPKIKKKDNSSIIKNLSYEDAFEKLKNIVDKMQEENISLEETIKLYKEGKILSEHCNRLLEEAKFEIENIMKDEDEV